MNSGGRQGPPVTSKFWRPHLFSLDQLGLVGSQRALDRLQHRPQLLAAFGRSFLFEVSFVPESAGSLAPIYLDQQVPRIAGSPTID